MRAHWERGAGIPRRVDRDQRRATIAEAILRIAASRGLDEVSLRDVAAEAGVSMGQVQHYFATKSEMLRFACAHMVERTRRAIADALAEAPEPASARAALRATITRSSPWTTPAGPGPGSGWRSWPGAASTRTSSPPCAAPG